MCFKISLFHQQFCVITTYVDKVMPQNEGPINSQVLFLVANNGFEPIP